MRLFDAHNHLHDQRLDACRDAALRTLEEEGLAAAVVNGTSEEDWAAVATWAEEKRWVRPAFGLHPWHVRARSPGWRERLVALLDRTPGASIGEIGLDRWQKGYDFPAQREVFQAQLALAAERNLPATVHCLQAWGALEEITRQSPRLERGWLLHAYGGPAELTAALVRRGAYFSFSPYFLQERKTAQRTLFRTLPLERLLVETDAPDMLPRGVDGAKTCRTSDSGEEVNSPENLTLAYRGLAEIRDMPLEGLAAQVEENFHRLFG